MVALTIVLRVAARAASKKTSRARSNAARPLANRFTKYAPTSPSSVFPRPMPIEVATEPAVVRFARNAPRKMPGQTWYPILKNAANAIPVGGQTGVALACTKASFSPSLAATKYTAARVAKIATPLGNRASIKAESFGHGSLASVTSATDARGSSRPRQRCERRSFTREQDSALLGER